MVVAEEWSPKHKPNQATPTGAARILRTQFHLLLTERPGLGVSWDEETPPVYEDVPASPPHYTNVTDFDLAEISGQMEEFHFDPNTAQAGTTMASSSTGTAKPSSSGSGSSADPPHSSAEIPANMRGRNILDVDDLLSGPLDRHEPTVVDNNDDDDDEDIEVVSAEPIR